jgi:hypothetical protein
VEQARLRCRNNTYVVQLHFHRGTLNINSTSAIGTGTFAINGGTIDNTTAGAITLSQIMQLPGEVISLLEAVKT